MLSICGLIVAQAAEPKGEPQIEDTIRQFFQSMAQKDLAGIQSTVEPQFLIVEASQKQSQVHLLDRANGEKLLPRNDDFDEDRLKILDIEVQRSATNPSVAMATFTMAIPLSEIEMASFQQLLKKNDAGLEPSVREAMKKSIANKAVQHAMFAMLARDGSGWKIVCLSVPK